MYLWIKALHVLAVISWMAGMLYLPRLFVYHAEAEKGSVTARTFEVMERMLLKAIMLPAMLVTWVTGVALAIEGHWFVAPWLHGKLLLVILMTACHGYFSRLRRQFSDDKNKHSSRFYRIMNEVPTVFMIGIVILVVVKPF